MNADSVTTADLQADSSSFVHIRCPYSLLSPQKHQKQFCYIRMVEKVWPSLRITPGASAVKHITISPFKLGLAMKYHIIHITQFHY